MVQEDEQQLAQFQALSLAEQISLMPSPRDEDDLARAVAQARGACPNVITVRLWDATSAGFSEHLSSSNSPTAKPIAEAQSNALQSLPTIAGSLPAQTLVCSGDTYYRVLAPIKEKAS